MLKAKISANFFFKFALMVFFWGHHQEVCAQKSKSSKSSNATEKKEPSKKKTEELHFLKNSIQLGVSTAGATTPFSLLLGYEYNFQNLKIDQLYSSLVFGSTVVPNKSGDSAVITMRRYQISIGAKKTFRYNVFAGSGLGYTFITTHYVNPTPEDSNSPDVQQIFTSKKINLDLIAGWSSNFAVQVFVGGIYSLPIIHQEIYANAEGQTKAPDEGYFSKISNNYDHRQETESIHRSANLPFAIFTGVGMRF